MQDVDLSIREMERCLLELQLPGVVAVDNPVAPTDYLQKFWVDSLVHDAKALNY